MRQYVQRVRECILYEVRERATHWLVEMVTNRVSQSADGIIENEQVLGLVLGESSHQHLHTHTHTHTAVSRAGGMMVHHHTWRISAR